MNTPDPFTEWDAAYVLGALSVADRRVFEEHLADCPPCRDAVSELAGMPGLLAGLPAADAIALGSAEPMGPAQPVPSGRQGDAELPPSLARMRAPRGGRRFRLLLAVSVAVALVVGAALGGLGGYLIRDRMPARADPISSSAPSASSVRVAFSPVHATSMIAVADLTRSGGGTMINIECQYPIGGSYAGSVDYILYVIDKTGQRQPGPRWSAGPGELETPKLHSELALWQIRSLEIDYAGSGHPAMRVDL